MEKRNLDHLRSHLSEFEPDYPIQKGYIARLLIANRRPVPDVLKEVRAIVQANDPGKELLEGSLKTHLYEFRKHILHKKFNLATEWQSLTRLFLEPLRITFKSLTIEPASSQPEKTSLPSPSRHSEPSVSLTSEMLLEPDIPVTPTLMQPEPNIPVTPTPLQPVQNSTTINSPSCLVTCKLPSPRKLKSYCPNCVNKQRTITNMMQKNKHLHQQCREFKMLKAEKGNFSLKRYNEKIKRKTQSATKWKTRYASLSEACRDTFNLLKLVQRLEQQVKTLEGKLTAAQEENINMASINKRLESLLVKMENGDAYLKQVNEQLKNKLEKAEDDNAHLKRVHEQLKSKLVKTEDQDVHMEQVHEQLQSILEKTEDDDGHLKRYSQASHSSEMEVKEESPWEAADNCGSNFTLQNDEIKQEHIYEEHPERSRWKEKSVNDENAAISKDVASNISMKDILCAEQCQVEAEGDCLDHGPSIYIDNAEVSCEHISAEHVNQTITAEEKVELISENEATSSNVQLCYTNSHAELKENGTHQSVYRT